MDHSIIDHSKMGHGHSSHGDMDMSCSMNMFVNTNTDNLCIVFKQWRVTGFWSLVQSILIIVLIAMAFEYTRGAIRRWEGSSRPIQLESSNSRPDSPELTFSVQSRKRQQFIKSILYAIQVGISFMLMLVFMTYNVYIMLAVVFGSGLGYYLFNNDPHGVGSKTMACH